MRRVVRRLFAVILAVACVLGFWTPVRAESDHDKNIVMSLRPSEQELDLKPGQHFEGSVVVYNVGKIPFQFKASVAPYQVKNDDYEQDFVSSSESTAMANWIKLPQTEFAVKPNQSAEVEFTIDVPDDIPGGGQYAAIIIRSEKDQQHQSGVDVIGQLAALLYVHVDGAELRLGGEIKEYELPSLMFGNKFEIKSVVENTGNVDFRVTETLSIKDFFTNREAMSPESVNEAGYPIGTISAAVLPGTARDFTMSWKDAPELGFFKVRHTISYLDQEQITEKVVLVCPLWLIVFVGILLVLMVIWLITALVGYRKEKPQVL